MPNKLTRDQRQIIFVKLFSVIAWHGGLLLLIRGYYFIWLRRELLGWNDVQFDEFDAWGGLQMIAGLASMKASSNRLNDKLTRAITFLPVLVLTYLTFVGIEEWIGQVLRPNELFGRKAFTPAWFITFQSLVFLLPLGLWLLAFESLREKARKAISKVVQILLGEKNGSPSDPTLTNEASGASSGDSSKPTEERKTKNDSTKHENKNDAHDATTPLRSALAILGLGGRASRTEIREAYRDLAQVWHPDRFVHNPRLQANAQRKLSEINNAYDLLEEFFNKKT
jgi:hypothetical protein